MLGVGAQRCGTTWLYRYLSQHPAVFISPFKELHVFDAMFAPEASGYTRERRFDRLRLMLDTILRGEPVDRQALMVAIERYELSLGENAYLAYFRRHVTAGHRVMGEITPSYSLIPSSGFRAVRQLLTTAGLKPRVVFIMRDPVERVYSQLRLNQDMGVAQVREAYASALSATGITLRTRYDLTLASLLGGFEADELLFLFYEELFQAKSVEVICRFLDIDVRPADFSARVNMASDAGEIDPGFRRAAREHFDVVYEACAGRFGRDRVRALWKYF